MGVLAKRPGMHLHGPLPVPDMRLPVPDMRLTFWGGGAFRELPLQLRLGSVLSWASVWSCVHSTSGEAVSCDVWGNLHTWDLESAGCAHILGLRLHGVTRAVSSALALGFPVGRWDIRSRFMGS